MKITIIGAAGVRTPLLIYGLAEICGQLCIDEVACWDTDSERLKAMGRVTAAMSKRSGLGAKLTICSSPEQGLADANYVLTSVRAGGIEARSKDETIALAHGLVGQETVGAGGFACAMRNLSVMLDYARLIERVAPHATVVNFTNPVGIISQGLLNHSTIKVVGVCDTPLETYESIATALGRNPFELQFDYFGLNHLGWIRGVRDPNGTELLPQILTSVELIQKCYRRALFPAEFIQKLGLLPTEYLYFYYFPNLAYQNTKRSGQSRGQAVAAMNSALFHKLAQAPESRLLDIYEDYLRERNESYFSIEATEVENRTEGHPLYSQFSGYERIAALLLKALHSDRISTIPLTVRNQYALENLDANDAVEVPCEVSSAGIRPGKVGGAPEVVRALLLQVKEYEQLTVRACVDGSSDAALSALLKNPLVAERDVARAVLSDYIKAFGDQMHLASPPSTGIPLKN